jgi:hypothetical protein
VLPDSLAGPVMRVINLRAIGKEINSTTPEDYSTIEFNAKGKNPAKSYSIPLVTGYNYKAHWSYGLDFLNITL